MADPNVVIPFTEGLPSDNLMVEELPDGDVLIGDPALDMQEEIDDAQFDINLAETIGEKELNRKAQELVSFYENDEAARSEWRERYTQGLQTLDPDGGLDEGDSERGTRGLSVVVHPLIAEAATQFNARAIAELYPSGGPVKTVILGTPSPELEDQARRTREYMNFQITQEMPEFFPDLDQMLFHLPLIGHTFKKVWWDANMDRQCSQFVKAEDFVVAPESKDLYTSPRYTHVIRMPKNDFNRYVQNGYYLQTKYNEGDSIDPSGDVIGEIEGVDQYDDSNDDVMTLLEMHVYDLFDGIDGKEMDDGDEDDNAVAIPYVITIDYESQAVVSVRRNWKEDDELKKRRDWFVSFKFLPGLGFYGFGLYHMIGGLGKAATGSLRALLDSAAFSNMQGGFKLRGRVQGGDMQISPGEFVDIDSTVDDVNKAIMPLPFKEPSGSLFNLLGYMVEAGQRFASTADLNIGDVNPNAPVGSTVALIEQGSKAFSAIHKRLHYAQGQELKLLAGLNAENLPDEFSFSQAGAAEIIYRADFDDRIDIVPVSDPNIFSTAQRIAQAQAVLEMARSAPQFHDLYQAYKRMYEAIRIPNIDEILKKPEEAVQMDPVDENMSVLYGKPIRAFPEQDHDAHIAVHMQFMQDPSLAGNPGAAAMQPVLIAHIAEHVALLYRQRMEASIQMELPPLPNFKDPDFKFEGIDPEMDRLISQRAAQVVQAAPQMKQIQALAGAGGPQGQGQGDPLQYAQQLAQLETEALKARTQAQIEADQAKAKSTIEIKQAEARQDMEIDAAKAQQDMQVKITKLQADLQLEREKNQAKMQMEAMKNVPPAIL
jgi:hypothetical protein|tara:strand:- start:603 stop:3077 length:2475 start_codon:yes stop_codon:yes gene_type:complete